MPSDVMPAAAPIVPPSERIAQEFLTLVRTSVPTAETLDVLLRWAAQAPGFDPVAFFSWRAAPNTVHAPSAKNALTKDRFEDESATLFHRVLLRLDSSRLQTLWINSAESVLSDRPVPRQAADAAPKTAAPANAWTALVNAPAGNGRVPLHDIWDHARAERPYASSYGTASVNITKDDVPVIGRLMTATAQTHWLWRDEPGAHPGSGWSADCLSLVKKEALRDGAVAPITERLIAAFGQERLPPERSPWLTLPSGRALRDAVTVLLRAGHRIDDTVDIGGGVTMPAWEWLFLHHTASSSPVGAALAMALNALPSDGSVAAPDLDPAVRIEPVAARAAAALKPNESLEDLRAWEMHALRAAAGASGGAAAPPPSASSAAPPPTAWSERQDLIAALEAEQAAAVPAAAPPPRPRPAVRAITERLHQWERQWAPFARLRPTDRRASTGYIRLVLEETGRDPLGRPALIELLSHRGDLLPKVLEAIPQRPVDLAKALRTSLIAQLGSTDRLGYPFYMHAFAHRDRFNTLTRLMDILGVPKTIGCADKGVLWHLVHRARWFNTAFKTHWSSTKDPLDIVDPRLVAQAFGPTALFGPPEQQRAWAKRIDAVVAGWARAPDQVPSPATLTPSVTMLARAFVRMREDRAVRDLGHSSNALREHNSAAWMATQRAAHEGLEPELHRALEVLIALSTANPECEKKIASTGASHGNQPKLAAGHVSCHPPEMLSPAQAAALRAHATNIAWKDHVNPYEACAVLGAKPPASYAPAAPSNAGSELAGIWIAAADRALLQAPTASSAPAAPPESAPPRRKM